MLVYKILRSAEWAAFDADGHFDGSADDRRDGFIHLSTREQVPGTLARHFANEHGLVVLEFDSDAMGDDLRWEASRDGTLFPHLYRQLGRAEIIGVTPASSPAV